MLYHVCHNMLYYDLCIFILIEGLVRGTKFVRLNQLFSVEVDAELSDESSKSTHVRLYRRYSRRKIN